MDPQPPIARREPVERRIHGDRTVDDYAWLRHKENPEVIAYLEAENAYTKAVLAPTTELQECLYQEMLGRIQQTDLSVPYRLRGYLYFTKTEEGKQYPLHFRRLAPEESAKSWPTGAENATGEPRDELLLDLNELAEGHSFLGLGAFEVSDNNQLLAYSSDLSGFRQYTLQIKDLPTGKLLPIRWERVTSAAWAADNRTLFYTVEDEITKRSHRLYRHMLGASAADELLYEEGDQRFRLQVERTRSGAYLLLVVTSHTASEVRYLRADDPNGTFHVIAPREDDHEYYADHHPACPAMPGGRQTQDAFVIRTNSGGRTFRLAVAPVVDPQRAAWREMIPNRPNVMLAGVAAFSSHLVLFEHESGLPQLRIVNLGKATPDFLSASHRIAFAEPAYSAALGENRDFAATHVRYTYESFITPRSVYDYDLAAGQSTLRKQQPVLGGYDPTQYKSERLEAVAADGTAVPISLVYRRATVAGIGAARLPIGGQASCGGDVPPANRLPRPALLYGYGSYGISIPVAFNSNRLSLLDRGFVYAIAHVRGGGALGKPWHDAGRMSHKKNTFTDFIACAEHLIAERYTSPDRLAIQGGSAGGLLMGAVCNMRPDLFHAGISQVPFVDVLNTMLDPSLPLTVGEYEEWGNPQIVSDYFYMKAYCPYGNIENKAYPAMLVKTGLNDSQVMYWEPAKYVAKLRALKTDGNPLLFQINMGAGHGGASGRYDYLREVALDYAFLLTQIGAEP